MKMFRFLAGILAFLSLSFAAHAQVGGGSPVYQNWFPQANSPSVAITSASSAHLYPGLGPTARICNTGNVAAYINPQGTANTVTATTNAYWLPAGTCQPYNIKPSTTQYTYFAAITASGSTTLYVETGLGSPGSLAGIAPAGGGALSGTTLALVNPSATVPAISVAQTGNVSGGGFLFSNDATALDAANGNFALMNENFPNINLPASSRGDTIWCWGYNVDSQCVQKKLTEPVLAQHTENNYIQGGTIGLPALMEHFVQFTSDDGSVTRRPIGFSINRHGERADAELTGTTISLNDWAVAQRVDFDFTNTSVTSIFHPLSTTYKFAVNGTCPIDQQNSTASAYICLIQLNASNHIELDAPFESIPGPVNISSPALTGGSAAINVNTAGGSDQAVGLNINVSSTINLQNVVQQTGAGTAANTVIAAANNAFDTHTAGSASWADGTLNSDGSYLISHSGTLNINNAFRIDPTTLAISGASGIVSQNQCSANSGSTNNSASGSGSFVLMTPNCSIPANAITSARSLIVYITFQYTTGSAPPGFHWELRAGSTVLAHFDPVTMTASQTNRTVTYAVKLSSTTAPGAAAPTITAAIGNPNQTNGITGGSNATAQPVNLPTNGALTLQVATLYDAPGTGTNTTTLLDMAVQWLN